MGQIGKVIELAVAVLAAVEADLLVVVVAAVVWALYKAGRGAVEAGERTLAAFATLLGVLVRTLPSVVLAGLIALGGVWILNNFDPSSVRVPTAFKLSSQ